MRVGTSHKGAVLSIIVAAMGLLLPASGMTWTGYNSVVILELTTYTAPATPGVLVKFSPGMSNLEGCTHPSTNYAWIDTTQSEGKSVYAAALAAHVSGAPVDIGVHGCSTDSYPRVYAVTVKK